MIIGSGQSLNTSSSLFHRSLLEMKYLTKFFKGKESTTLGLAGVGDLVVTCSTPLSRNYRIGQALGEGRSIEQALTEVGQVAEGVNTLRLVKEKADELGVYMPLVNGLYRIVYGNQPIKNIVSSLTLSDEALDVEFAAKDEKVLNEN